MADQAVTQILRKRQRIQGVSLAGGVRSNRD